MTCAATDANYLFLSSRRRHTRLVSDWSSDVCSSDLENAAVFFENSPEWAGVLGYNEFTGGYHILQLPPSPVTSVVGTEIQDHFDAEAVRWLERRGLMVKP